METAPALFSLQYHVAKIRGSRGDPGFADWLRKARKVEERGGSLVDRIVSSEEAIGVLGRESRPRFKRQAAVIAAEGYLSSGDKKSRAEYGAHLDKLRPGAVRHLASRPKVPGQSTSATVASPNIVFKWLKRVYGADGVTRVGAEATLTVGAEAFQDYAARADPRNWAKYSAPTFRKTYQTPKNPEDPWRDPPASPVLPCNPPGTPWKGLLFEFACPGVPPAQDMFEYRNILNIDFSFPYVAPVLEVPSQQLHLTYSLNESLTSSVFGIKNEGGIDVDSGEGSMTCTGGKGGGVVVTAEKDIRFTEAAAFSEELNAMSLPFLLVWMRLLVLESLV
jgi:hypothetical protein